ncbi:MAG TPA: M48 family metallopeptidase [Thermoanaerobaculia bacterium]|nr:M48 family metallopeptidase [Thermoanaerobaculia bacterium]
MKHAKIPLIVITLLALSCGGSGGDFNLISVEEEWQLGAQISQDVARQVRFNTDPAVNEYVRSVGQRIVAQTPYANLPWEFHVIEDPEINAFAIPGGHVYVNTGLISAAHNASELAGAMAHEISHVVARHSTEQISRQYGLSVLAGVVLGQNPSVVQELAAQIIAGGALAKYSRAAESEADELGVQFMFSAGYNPRGMVTMFETLLAQQRSNPSRVERFFATHPTTDSRIRDVQARIDKLPQRTGLITDEAEFQQIHRRVA